MTTPNSSRAELIQNLTTLCEKYPHWRFGQLVSNVAGWADVELWDIEDDQLCQAAAAHLQTLAKRESVNA